MDRSWSSRCAACTDMAGGNAMADGDTAPDMKVSDGETGADAGAAAVP